VGDGGEARLERYLELLLAKNKEINLTACRELEEARKLHIEDSKMLALVAPKAAPRFAVDLGSGSGFPGVAIAALFPETRVFLVERRQRKAAALAELVRAAGFDRVEVVNCDGRALLHHHPELRAAVALVTARAVARLDTLVEIAAPWLASTGQLVCWKSRNLSEDERAAGRAAARRLRLGSERRVDYELEGYRGGCLIVYAAPRVGSG
jgi:16S rRNA (guanine527-N7)-methyltransferase